MNNIKEIEEIIKDWFKDEVSLKEIAHFDEWLWLIKMLNNLKSKKKKYEN